MKIISGHQPVYLPWLGLFHKIALCDLFIEMDDVQYLKRSWNNRNRIKGPHGPVRLSVPVSVKQSDSLAFKDIRIDDSGFGRDKNHWQREHWQSMQSGYGKAPYWSDHAQFFEQLYTRNRWRFLAPLNRTILDYLLHTLQINVTILTASDMGFTARKSDLILEHCTATNAQAVVLGTHGRDYLVTEDFTSRGIHVCFQNYRHPTYPQRFGEFISHLSVVDLLFNVGPEAGELILTGNLSKTELITRCDRADRPMVIDD